MLALHDPAIVRAYELPAARDEQIVPGDAIENVLANLGHDRSGKLSVNAREQSCRNNATRVQLVWRWIVLQCCKELIA